MKPDSWYESLIFLPTLLTRSFSLSSTFRWPRPMSPWM